eukprot:2414542-Lingulodinium_polyedra.AAC.1
MLLHRRLVTGLDGWHQACLTCLGPRLDRPSPRKDIQVMPRPDCIAVVMPPRPGSTNAQGKLVLHTTARDPLD